MDSDSLRSPGQDPFLFDTEQLHLLAEADVVRAGLRHFKDNRVTELDCEGQHLWASVEDEDTEEVVSLELSYDGDSNLRTDCECEGDPGHPCSHVLAALFAYGARSGRTSELVGAVESAIGERVKRGRAEVRVEHLSGQL